jgi:hypothetical protein
VVGLRVLTGSTYSAPVVSANIQSGARFDLRRVSEAGRSATYRVIIELPDAVRHELEVAVDADAEPPTPAVEAPTWVNTYLCTLLKQLHRKGQKGTPWPRMVRQWKPDK